MRSVGNGVIEWTTPAGYRYTTSPMTEPEGDVYTPVIDLIREDQDNQRYIDPEDFDARDIDWGNIA